MKIKDDVMLKGKFQGKGGVDNDLSFMLIYKQKFELFIQKSDGEE